MKDVTLSEDQKECPVKEKMDSGPVSRCGAGLSLE